MRIATRNPPEKEGREARRAAGCRAGRGARPRAAGGRAVGRGRRAGEGTARQPVAVRGLLGGEPMRGAAWRAGGHLRAAVRWPLGEPARAADGGVGSLGGDS